MTLHQHSALRRGVRIGGSSLFVLTVALSTAACSSSEKSGGPIPNTSAASAASGSSSDPSAAESNGASSAGGATATACVKDSNYLSGSSTVIWTPDSKSKHTTAEATADHKFALKADGTLEPSTIEVGVGEVFNVTVADDAQGVTVLTIGCDGGQTMVKGVPAGVYITAPGTYAATSGFGTDPAGTVVVK